MRLLLAVLLLAGCARSAPTAPEDPVLARLDHAGSIAFNQENPDQAVVQYRSALARARTRDDAAAIADTGFGLATAEMLAGRPREAMRTARELQAELLRRGIVDPDFDLIAATGLFRLNDLAAADHTAARLTQSKKPALADAAWFLRGLIADTKGDRPGLEKALGSLTASADPGDRLELRARLTHSADVALQAADSRRERLDYRGLSRALALAGQFTQDDAAAADLYLRAGRSAAAQGDGTNARLWLREARRRAGDTALRGVAEKALRELSSR